MDSKSAMSALELTAWDLCLGFRVQNLGSRVRRFKL